MTFRKYFYRKEEVGKNNKSMESVDENNVKMLKLYINGGKCTMYNTV